MPTKNNIMYMVASRDTTKYSIRVITSSEEEAYKVWNREYPKFKKTVKSVDEAILLVKLFDLTNEDIQLLEDSKADIKVAAKQDFYIQHLVADNGDCLEYYELGDLEESMNETTYVYIVHSDINENNIYAEFATEEEAIEYARRNKDELTYVDKVEVALDEDGDIIEEFDSETIWVYDYEDDLAESLKFSEEENKEFHRLCREIGIIDDRDLYNFKKEVGCTDDNLLQALRDYRAELGPDFEIQEDIDFDGLVEALEENEDVVECKECFELFPKASGIKVEHGYVCPNCHTAVEDDWSHLDADFSNDFSDDDIFKMDFPEYKKFRDEDGEWEFVDDREFEGPNPQPTSICVGPECEAPVEAPQTKEEVVDTLVRDEEEAIDQYNAAQVQIDSISDLDTEEKEKIKDVLDHIKEEEHEHIEELVDLVDTKEEPVDQEEASNKERLDESLKTWDCWFDEKYLGTVEAEDEQSAYDEMCDTWPELPYGLYDGVAWVSEYEDTETDDVLFEAAAEEDELDLELKKKQKELKLAKLDNKIAKQKTKVTQQQVKQAKNIKAATRHDNSAIKDTAKTDLVVTKKANAGTADTAKTNLTVTKKANAGVKSTNSTAKNTAKTNLTVTKANNAATLDDVNTDIAISDAEVKVAKNDLKVAKLNNKIDKVNAKNINNSEQEQVEETLTENTSKCQDCGGELKNNKCTCCNRDFSLAKCKYCGGEVKDGKCMYCNTKVDMVKCQYCGGEVENGKCTCCNELVENAIANSDLQTKALKEDIDPVKYLTNIKKELYKNSLGTSVFIGYDDEGYEGYLRFAFDDEGKPVAYYYTSTNYGDWNSDEELVDNIEQFESFEAMIKYLADSNWLNNEDSELTPKEVYAYLKSLDNPSKVKQQKQLYDIFKDGDYVGQLWAFDEDDAVNKCYNGAFGLANSDDMFEAELAEDYED